MFKKVNNYVNKLLRPSRLIASQEPKAAEVQDIGLPSPKKTIIVVPCVDGDGEFVYELEEREQ